MSGEWKARVIEDWALMQARLVVFRERGDRLETLMPDGSWNLFDPAAVMEPTPGLPLPNAALPALASALTRHLGDTLPSAGEVRTLREWLAVEQGRVDRALERS